MQDALQHPQRQAVGGEADDIQPKQGTGAHGVDVTDRIGGRDGAEPVGVIDDGGEEVHGLHNGGILADAIYGCVVSGFCPDQHGRVNAFGQGLQHFFQGLRTQLAGAAQPVGVMGQLDFFLVHIQHRRRQPRRAAAGVRTASWLMVCTAWSISSAVVPRPTEKRTVPIAHSTGQAHGLQHGGDVNAFGVTGRPGRGGHLIADLGEQRVGLNAAEAER